VIVLSYGSDPDESTHQAEGAEESLSLEETIIQWTITVVIPLLITFIAFGVIIYAYSEWKLY
jgi:hypothetical protein